MRLRMNRGSTYESNVAPREDISITKHGLKIPADAADYEGAGQREIERNLGVAHGTMTDMVKRMRSILQQHVTREDILG